MICVSTSSTKVLLFHFYTEPPRTVMLLLLMVHQVHHRFLRTLHRYLQHPCFIHQPPPEVILHHLPTPHTRLLLLLLQGFIHRPHPAIPIPTSCISLSSSAIGSRYLHGNFLILIHHLYSTNRCYSFN